MINDCFCKRFADKKVGSFMQGRFFLGYGVIGSNENYLDGRIVIFDILNEFNS